MNANVEPAMSVINVKMILMNAYKMAMNASTVANALIYKQTIHASVNLVIPVDNAKLILTNAKVSHAWTTQLVLIILMDIIVSVLKISPVYIVKQILISVLANLVFITAIVPI